MENDSFQHPKNKAKVPQSFFNVVSDKNAAATLLFHVKHNLRASMLGAHSGKEQAKEGFV